MNISIIKVQPNLSQANGRPELPETGYTNLAQRYTHILMEQEKLSF